MKEEELKYMLRLLDDLTEEVFEELIQFYYDIEESKTAKDISESTLNFFRINLKTNPVITSTILKYIQEHLVEKQVSLTEIQNLYLEAIKNELPDILRLDKLMTLISSMKWEDSLMNTFTQQVLKPLSEETYRQYRKQILISLVPHDRPQLLGITSEFMQKNEPQKEFKLTPEYMLELCYQDKTHWLLKAAQVYKHQLHDLKNVTFKINNFTKQILIMVLIDLTNSPETYDLPSLVHQLTNIFSILDTYTTADEQLQFYITEVKRELTLIKFCLENNCKIMTTSIFSQVLAQSALAVISQVCRLSKVDRYKISRLLNTNNDYINELLSSSNKHTKQESSINWDITTYNSYCAITKIIDTIVNSSNGSEDVQDTTNSLDDIKRLVLSIKPVQCCIEVIENIFSCLFLRYEFFSCPEHNQEDPCGTHSECSYFYSKKQVKSPSAVKSSGAGFMCNSLTTQVILNSLKMCLEILESNISTEDVDQNVVSRLKRLVKVVNHSIWKLQLVSSLSPETSSMQLKLCLDYVDVDNSSEDEEREIDLKMLRKKPKARRRYTNSRADDQVMFTSTISATDDVFVSAKGNSIDFISIMLAKPNSLVALSLYHNDFSKANQILEMFDLSDSEIATEVTFTEQLRNLVAKIKNMIYYRSDTRYPTKELSALSVVSTEVMGLVDGFLAANRAPNSFDIIELGARHPHLQLYSHQNAPLINSVDILLSSGLNREITYGLINVVERKLAEVRSGTDVAAVKKTNYIRFVEDITSVAFEIFGNTEKSFDFVDNICGLITDCRVPIKHKEFCKMNQLAKELKQSCEELSDVVNTHEFLDIDQNLSQKYHQIYMNVVAASDKDLYNIGDVCYNGSKKARVHYLRMCYIYCKTVSQLEQEDKQSTESGVDTPYFFVLEKPLHDIFGNMINNKEIPVTFLEPICKKLNVNLIPKLILNFCPSITLIGPQKEASEETFNMLLQVVYDCSNPEENLFIEPEANFSPLPRAPDPQCLTYIVLHNWVLAHIIKKIHISPNENSLNTSMDARTKCLNNYMDLERFTCTKVLFGGNKYLASLHSTVDLEKLFQYMPQLIEAGKVLKCLNIINSLSERQLMCSANLMNLRDLILVKLATNPKIPHNWKYCQYLKCPELKVDLILNNLSSWPAEGAVEILDYLRFHLEQVVLEDGLYERCTDWMTKIPLYDQIAAIMGESHWYNVYLKSVENPENVIEVLMDSQQFKLCLEWADVHDVSEHMKNLIVMNLLRQLFEYTNQATPDLIRELLLRLPTIQATDLIQDEMSKVKNVEILQVCVDFISENSHDWKSFENIQIGLQIMLDIDLNMRNVFWDLIENPLLMIEQFLMNAKLDLLATIINKISPSLKKDPSGDNLYYNIKSIESLVVSRNAVDALLRFYAEKALDMRNPHNRVSSPPKPSDDSLMQSIDSINIESATKPFVMPEQVPTKEQWVEDYSADRCMLCHTSIFSMIMRRHHCRRCGRLVCHACSRHRMQVPTYPSGVKFRVCDDCFTQTMTRKTGSDPDNLMLSSNSDSAASGVTCMDWCLSANARKNEAVRAEFSYEFTPNVTLCLSIMKMHSINLDYPRFLLDRSDEVARELSQGGDARLLVRARRSLLLAAAELYARAPADRGGVAETGALHAARCLSHADAMAALVRHQAHALVPRHSHGAHPSQIVRCLLEAEKWELALEIATKSGLPRNSVLAAWGKACLKAGCFKQAREKFAHCFKSVATYSEVEECEYGREARETAEPMPGLVNKRLLSLRQSRSSSVSSGQSEGRPRATPPLLAEIVTLLEDSSYPVSPAILHKADTIKSTNEKLITMNTSKKKIPVTEPALNIMHTLSSVKKIKLGDYSDFQTATVQPKKTLAQGLLRRNNHSEPKTNHKQKLDPFFYNECVYYLSNYGSHVSNISFYMKHSNLTEVIRYCYDNLVDKETFTEAVYMECLKKDKVNDLVKAMTDVDSTLEMWAEYITHICRTLETTKRLDALYALQTASGQHARASATCALLYSRPVPAAGSGRVFGALLQRQHHLAAALHHLGQCVPVANRINDPKTLNFHLDKFTIDNLMSTITRQIEVAKYLAACETSGRLTEKVLQEIIPLQSARNETASDSRPLTLFGSNTDKIRLVAVILATGQTIEVGFELVIKIIREHKLDSMSVYTHVARHLVAADRFLEVKALARCIRGSGETAASLMSDQVLEAGVGAVVARCEARGQLHDEMAELLVQDIHSVPVKISCYLVCRNVSSAYILAARHERTSELRRVLQEAERLANDQVRSACLKRLSASAKTAH